MKGALEPEYPEDAPPRTALPIHEPAARDDPPKL
jgi:hypothetical protein